MPWSSGTYTLPRSMVSDDSAGIRVLASNFDEQFNDIRDGLNIALTEDGQNVPISDLPMAGFRHTNVASASSVTDYARADQVQADLMTFARATGAGAYTITLSPSAALIDGMEVGFICSATNSASATLQVNSASARPIAYQNNIVLTSSQIIANAPYRAIYNSSATAGGVQGVFQLTNVAVANTSAMGVVMISTSAEMSAGGVSGEVIDSLGHGNLNVLDVTATLSGFSAATTSLLQLRRHGDLVTLFMAEVNSGENNATVMSVDNSSILPSWGRPPSTMRMPIQIRDNAVLNIGSVVITSTGSISFFTSTNNAAFTAAGNKGFSAFTITYPANG